MISKQQENRKRRYKVVFILGANITKTHNKTLALAKNDPNGLPLLSEWRVRAVGELYKQKIARKFVFVGYKEKNLDSVWRPDAMKSIVNKKFKSIPKRNVVALRQKEDKTRGNAKAIKKYIREKHLPKSECAFLTNFYHIPRAIIEMDDAGLRIRPLAAESFFIKEEIDIRRDYGQKDFGFFDRLIGEMKGMGDWEFGKHK